MKKTILLLMLAICTTTMFAQEKKKTAPATPKSTLQQKDPKSASPAQQKQPEVAKDNSRDIMMEYMKPSRYHEMLARTSGEWKEVILMWTSPDAAPVKYTANCVVSMILDGRYQETIHSGNFDEMDFYGRGIVGFDNAIGKFVSTWIDNMGTGIMYTEGTYNAQTGVIVFEGDMVDPIIRKKVKVREVLTPKADNEQVFEMFVTPPGGKEFKSMEITMTR